MLKGNISYALRTLQKRKTYSAVIIVTLAVGIGISTAMFSFVSSVLLHPLPFENPEQLVIIESVRGGVTGRISQREIADMLENTTVFEDVAGYNPAAQYNLTGQGDPEEIPTTICSSNLFSVLGIPLFKGQSWPEDFDGRRAFGIVLTYDLWKRKFQSDASYLNGTITLDAHPEYTVFGVLPEGFDFPKGISMYRSASWFDAQSGDRNFRDRIGLARIRSDTDINEVQWELNQLAKKLVDRFPETNGAISFSVKPLTDLYVGPIRPYLWLLFISVALVVVISCVNVSNLMLSAGAQRDKEVAIRTVLGSSRVSLVRVFLTESMILSLSGALLGIGVAWVVVHYFKEDIHAALPHWLSVNIDGTVLTFTIAVSVLTGLLAGIVPSLKMSDINISRLIKESKGSAGGKHRNRLRKALIVLELSLALIVLVGTGLILKSFEKLRAEELGFNPNNKLTYRISLPWRKYGEMKNIHYFYRNLLVELKKNPGIKSIVLNDNLPLTYEASQEKRDDEFTIEGQSLEEQRSNPYAKYQTVTSEYFNMMEIPLLAGRYIEELDDTLTTPVAVINQALAHQLFPNGNALNKRIKFGKPDSPSQYKTIVGIVANVRHDDLRKSQDYHVYLSCWQRGEPNQFVIIETESSPMAIASEASAAVWKVDGEQSVYELKTMEEHIGKKLWQDKLVSTLFTLFSIVAAILAAVGIYSVMSYAIAQRTKEFGVRRVLGASGSEIAWMVQKEAFILSTLALVIGTSVSLFLVELLKPFLYQVNVWDVGIYVTVGGMLMIITSLATVAPSAKATLVNPVTALKNE